MKRMGRIEEEGREKRRRGIDLQWSVYDNQVMSDLEIFCSLAAMSCVFQVFTVYTTANETISAY